MSSEETPKATPMEKLLLSIENQLKVKDDQLRKNNELLEKYVLMLEEKNKRIEELYSNLLEVNERAVQYPAKSHQTPMLCVAREFNCLRAITGQKVHVNKMKRELTSAAEVVIDSVRPNPQVDFNNIVNYVETEFKDTMRLRNKRHLVFETEDDAIKVAAMCKSLLAKKERAGDKTRI
ncbi:baculovirus repeated ORF [Anticarsia gemmatalis multiple nucleopolyhedrovirus]|uniref:Baculovirus repeated ORF n=1 Tax=Anticarsia gemmatalis multiple nucleopolyhedrovirus TaxID=268591 RepID=A0A0S3IXP5_9ABAC|nr:baculovirus repeated ORF [Anticarsia gemmatalis multiple nucleopolyhedrovirus]YP_803509.1 baculovirus repeated ORF [Anticarsia gemmatalis nucleopolyhedrovirus]ABI13898.1 baculovirus repeated ORF [Anticarsia gemmatalis multiple nucleopolyhedrovirus]ALR69852.1 baculovirus repeated ORF [Anticarsia gemmatalis multiple nucleopolyhedrovirus]ALR70010.1 baculovirus repeated ORF [Anticarsia gemmatalis multiple nucleopolyhedrovirus]ALR70167.1 baculovirus repeated ORF [Anticarsia gemmatalis multiple n